MPDGVVMSSAMPPSSSASTSASLSPRAGASTAACFDGAFLAGAFLAGAFLAGAFLAAVFLAGAFAAAVFVARAVGAAAAVTGAVTGAGTSLAGGAGCHGVAGSGAEPDNCSITRPRTRAVVRAPVVAMPTEVPRTAAAACAGSVAAPETRRMGFTIDPLVGLQGRAGRNMSVPPGAPEQSVTCATACDTPPPGGGGACDTCSRVRSVPHAEAARRRERSPHDREHPSPVPVHRVRDSGAGRCRPGGGPLPARGRAGLHPRHHRRSRQHGGDGARVPRPAPRPLPGVGPPQ